jgi:hypothetical protein
MFRRRKEKREAELAEAAAAAVAAYVEQRQGETGVPSLDFFTKRLEAIVNEAELSLRSVGAEYRDRLGKLEQRLDSLEGWGPGHERPTAESHPGLGQVG